MVLAARGILSDFSRGNEQPAESPQSQPRSSSSISPERSALERPWTGFCLAWDTNVAANREALRGCPRGLSDRCVRDDCLHPSRRVQRGVRDVRFPNTRGRDTGSRSILYPGSRAWVPGGVLMSSEKPPAGTGTRATVGRTQPDRAAGGGCVAPSPESSPEQRARREKPSLSSAFGTASSGWFAGWAPPPGLSRPGARPATQRPQTPMRPRLRGSPDRKSPTHDGNPSLAVIRRLHR